MQHYSSRDIFSYICRVSLKLHRSTLTFISPLLILEALRNADYFQIINKFLEGIPIILMINL